MTSRALGLTISARMFRLLASSTAHAKQFPSPMFWIVSSRRSCKMVRTRTRPKNPSPPGTAGRARAPATAPTFAPRPARAWLPPELLASDRAPPAAAPARPWRRTPLLPRGPCARRSPLGVHRHFFERRPSTPTRRRALAARDRRLLRAFKQVRPAPSPTAAPRPRAPREPWAAGWTAAPPGRVPRRGAATGSTRLDSMSV